MYVKLDQTCGTWHLRFPVEDIGNNAAEGRVYVPDQVYRAWLALQDQLTVFDDLFRRMENERLKGYDYYVNKTAE